LLPRESLRFFYIDDNWVLVLACGALSLCGTGIENESGDKRSNSLHDNLSRFVDRYLSGATPSMEPKSSYMGEVKTGFLLRSELVSGWPGLEAEIFTQNPAPVKPLRLERLGDSVLFGLVEGRIESIILKQPPEGLVFSIPPKVCINPGGVCNIEEYLSEKKGSAEFACEAMVTGVSQSIVWKGEQK
jgi:hypothetical protein